jgi:hypothetical protein
MENYEKDEIKDIDEKEHDKDCSLEIDNLNINQEVDIKENPKKHIVNTKKKHILKNSLDDNYIDSENLSSIKQKQSKKNIAKKSITYEDIYLGNEMLITRAKSLPKDFDKNNKYIKNFSKMYNKRYSSNSNNSSMSNNSNNSNSNSNNNSSSTNNISNISLGEEEEYDDDEIGVIRNNSCDYFSKAEESSHLKDFLASINNYRKNTENMIDEEDNIFIDEDEKKK